VPDDDATAGDDQPDARPPAEAPDEGAPVAGPAGGGEGEAGAGEPNREEAAEEPTPALTAAADPMRELRWTRLLLPVLLPVGAAVMIAVFVLNVSRIFLAAGSTGSIVLGVALIVLILGGAAGISAAPRLRTSSIVMMCRRCSSS
jgi:hypothetical protein